MSNSTQDSAPASVTKADVISNVDTEKSVSLVNGILRLTYHESILQDSVKAYVVFSDVGNSIEGKSTVEGLPLIGTEDFRLEFEDNNEEKIRVSMNVNKVAPIYEDGSKNVVSLELVSEEFIRNEMGETRLRSRFDGNISKTATFIGMERSALHRKLKQLKITEVE